MSYWPSGAYAGVSAQMMGLAIVSGISVTITSPTEAATVATAALPISWSFGPGTQATRRVRIYASDGTTLVHDSGVTATASQSYVTPLGLLTSGSSYKIRVDITTTTGGNAGYNHTLRSVTMSFATAGNVSGITVTPVTSGIPHNHAAWSQVTPGGGEVFQQYEVFRRKTGSTPWTRIGLVAAVATVTFDDYTVPFNVAYDYAITYNAASGGNILESALAATSATLTVSTVYIHVNGAAPTVYAHLSAMAFNKQRAQDIAYRRARGRQLDTPFVNEREAALLSLEVIPLALTAPTVWTDLEALQTAQRPPTSAILCLRSGHFPGETFFVTIDTLSRDDSAKANLYGTKVPMHQVYYAEAV